ncbi:hypothetical protein D8674_024049 [Pyrus ussuriensis x Pyrus communis]|uniref:Uncharacterized protein n=1 Tax=Pyrus ussuriensis x Pyrus communis TaxID=2448454 RepID=A0A5N5H3S7_9ROSA|nr:hypothetical protein D8674_024049 [Pyrus ussuriensis x Pyrus communis]
MTKKKSSSSEKCNSSGKPVRRRFTTKRGSKTRDVNAAEIRREILHAIQLHRSSSSSSSSLSAAPEASAPPPPVFVGPRFDSLAEPMPLPGPVWSTTAPSVLPYASSSAAMEALEFEWGESQAASYSWWLGFLKTLDGKNAEKSNYPLPLGSSNWLFGQNQNSNSNCKVDDDQDTAALVDTIDQSHSPDEWLMFPNTEDDVGEIVIP